MDAEGPLREELEGRVLEARHRLFRVTVSRSWSPGDLTMAQARALALLDHTPPLTVGEVAGLIGTGRPAASMLVDRLVQGGLAQRSHDPSDRRRALVTLTNRGRSLLERLREGDRERFQRWVHALNMEELAGLAVGFSALARVAEGEPARPQSAPASVLRSAAEGR